MSSPSVSPPSILESQGPRGGPPMHQRQMWSEELLSFGEPVSSAVKQESRWHVAVWRGGPRHTNGGTKWAP